MGSCVHTMGVYEKARDYYQKAADIYKTCFGLSHPRPVDAPSGLALVYDEILGLESALGLNQHSSFLKKCLKFKSIASATAMRLWPSWK
jgi:hypothetical protein